VACTGADGGNTEAPVTTPFVLSPGAPTWGANPGSPITDDYTSPFKFTGTVTPRSGPESAG
jgi:hypothetical protein